MIRLGLVLLMLLVGCAHQEPFISDRHVVVQTTAGLGSAVCLGRGLIITTRHVLFDGDGERLRARLCLNGVCDSNFAIVSIGEDIVLVRSRIIGNFIHLPRLGTLRVGMDVNWVQAFYSPGPGGVLMVQKLIMRGMVAQKGDNYMLLDRPLWPGSSGSGVYDLMGRLVGIVHGYVIFVTPVYKALFGRFSPIPREVEVLLEREERSKEVGGIEETP